MSMAPGTKDHVLIREVCTADVDAVAALAPTLTAGMSQWIPQEIAHGSTRGWLVTSAQQGNDDTQGAFVAVLNDVVVGFVAVSRSTRWYGQVEGNVGELVVAPEHQGAGVGGALLYAAEQWCISKGLTRVFLQTGAANLSAIGFYDRHGYATEEVLLSKALPSS